MTKRVSPVLDPPPKCPRHRRRRWRRLAGRAGPHPHTLPTTPLNQLHLALQSARVRTPPHCPPHSPAKPNRVDGELLQPDDAACLVYALAFTASMPSPCSATQSSNPEGPRLSHSPTVLRTTHPTMAASCRTSALKPVLRRTVSTSLKYP